MRTASLALAVLVLGGNATLALADHRERELAVGRPHDEAVERIAKDLEEATRHLDGDLKKLHCHDGHDLQVAVLKDLNRAAKAFRKDIDRCDLRDAHEHETYRDLVLAYRRAAFELRHLHRVATVDSRFDRVDLVFGRLASAYGPFGDWDDRGWRRYDRDRYGDRDDWRDRSYERDRDRYGDRSYERDRDEYEAHRHDDDRGRF